MPQRLSARSLLMALAMFVFLPAAWAGLPETIARVKPSVVAVGTYMPTRSPAFHFAGTGFVVGDGTLVATNYHELKKVLDADKLETVAIAIPGKRTELRQARVLRSDPAHDLSLLKLTNGLPLMPLTLADVEVPDGTLIAFTGFPIGNVLGFVAVTHRGIVAAHTPISVPRRSAQELDSRVIRSLAQGAFEVYQLDATAYPGNSGSPMYDPDTGEVLGILNMVFVKSTKENILSQPSGISYAIPVRYLKALMASP